MQSGIQSGRLVRIDLIQAVRDGICLPAFQKLGDRDGVKLASRDLEASSRGFRFAKKSIRHRHSGFHSFSITRVIPSVAELFEQRSQPCQYLINDCAGNGFEFFAATSGEVQGAWLIATDDPCRLGPGAC
jgi:hypothetical protein